MLLNREGFMESTLKSYPAEMPWPIVPAKNQLFAIAAQELRGDGDHGGDS
jgi:hypothetical protein